MQQQKICRHIISKQASVIANNFFNAFLHEKQVKKVRYGNYYIIFHLSSGQ